MIGNVCEVNFGYAFIACCNRRYFCHASEMPIDEVGRRYLLPNEKVSFELNKHNGRIVATNVELCAPHAPVDVNSYTEEGRVQSVRRGGRHAFLLRPFGGVAMLALHNVRDWHQPKFFAGQQWRYKLEPPEDAGRPWLAVDAVEVPLN